MSSGSSWDKDYDDNGVSFYGLVSATGGRCIVSLHVHLYFPLQEVIRIVSWLLLHIVLVALLVGQPDKWLMLPVWLVHF